jgi:alcohol oxidase
MQGTHQNTTMQANNIHTELPARLAKDGADVIIAGGGTAGCVVAARLAAAFPNLTIVVIEAGSDNVGASVIYPALFIAHLAPDAPVISHHLAKPSPCVAGREIIIGSGRALGGGSSVNLLAYSRPPAVDFDAWDVPGWSGDEMIEYFKRFETYSGTGKEGVHGCEGPIGVSGGRFRTPRAEDAFLRAAGLVGLKEVDDVQSMRPAEVNAVQRMFRYVSPGTGRRQDAATCHLKPRLRDGKHPNLHVLVEHQIVRVIVDDVSKKAVGIECRPTPDLQPSRANEPATTIKARKMVVVSCGAVGSPLVLERSGIGSAEILERAGIPLVADLPGVGENYMDHQLLMYSYHSSLEPGETLDAAIRGEVDFEKLIRRDDPILSWNGQVAGGKFRPSTKEVAELGEEFKKAWDDGDFEKYPERPLMQLALVSAHAIAPLAPKSGQYFTLSVFNAYPHSRGHVHVTGPGLDDTPDIDSGFLSDEHGFDVKGYIWAYKRSRELARRMDTYRGEVANCHPPFPSTSGAAVSSTTTTTTIPYEAAPYSLEDIRNIEYTPEDDAVIE